MLSQERRRTDVEQKAKDRRRRGFEFFQWFEEMGLKQFDLWFSTSGFLKILETWFHYVLSVVFTLASSRDTFTCVGCLLKPPQRRTLRAAPALPAVPAAQGCSEESEVGEHGL